MKEKKYIDITYAQIIAVALVIIAVFVAIFENIPAYASTDVRPTSGSYLEYNGQYLTLDTNTFVLYADSQFQFAGTGSHAFSFKSTTPYAILGHSSSLAGASTQPTFGSWITTVYASSLEALPQEVRWAYQPLSSCPIYHETIVFDSSIMRYIAVAGSPQTGIALDYDKVSQNYADKFIITISGKRPSLTYMNTVINTVNGLSSTPAGFTLNRVPLNNIYNVYDVVNKYRVNGLSYFAQQQNITPSYTGSYTISFDTTAHLEDNFFICDISETDWNTANRNYANFYTPTSAEEPYYFGLSSIETITVTPQKGNRQGVTTVSRFDTNGNLLTYYAINTLPEQATQEEIQKASEQASDTEIEYLRKQNQELYKKYNENLREYVNSQLQVEDNDNGILGAFSDITSSVMGAIGTLSGISAMVSFTFSCFPPFVIDVISFTIIALCFISIYKALRG